jgi:acyl transferase domain-containing protein/3-hydroxymyristoyl/3-hydroxydecanoyl-(acyl carrier protein) dehydratase/1-acyl-sn-glycerol-3-phosphate acyltransferase
VDRVPPDRGFEPIAIVGHGCILPGCATPTALWDTVAAGACQVGDPPAGDWRIDMDRVLSAEPGRYSPDRSWSAQAGYVRGFDAIFDPGGTALDAALVRRLDPVFQWSLYAAREAVRGVGGLEALKARAGVVLGNLSYPTRSHNFLAEQEWVRQLAGVRPPAGKEVHPWNRFMSGLPAMLVARALGLGGGSLALDAACASSLYAVKIACDRLQERRADLMLAGGVNAADQLFLHIGFSALNAMSRTGRSQPFSAAADGLVPAEGAAFVALKRLDDAVAAGDTVLGVIRAVGLSNDGRGGGFLSPSREGQVGSMRAALAQAGLGPADVQYVECHATGTQVGDATEVRSLAEVYGDQALALGSLKANLGHLLTASGVAGLLKTLLAMEHGQIPPAPASRPLAGVFADTRFRVPEGGERWDEREGNRTAAVSSFGFGGNNAHLIVQQHAPAARGWAPRADLPAEEIALVAVAVRTHLDPDAHAFTRRVLGLAGPDEAPGFDPDVLVLPARELAFPPADLREALGQQLILLDVVHQATRDLAPLDLPRTGIYVGMQTDSVVCRYAVRMRWADGSGAGLEGAADGLTGPLTSAGVIGKMPNICANRLSNQLDVRGPGFAVSREELSGDAALDLACTAIRRGEIHTALVAAVDLSREEVHAHAAREALGDAGDAQADAAVVLVLKSRSRALADGDRILALVAPGTAPASALVSNEAAASPIHSALGHSHAASGLLHVALAAGMLEARCRIADDGTVQPILRDGAPLTVAVANRSFGGESADWLLREPEEPARPRLRLLEAPALRRYAAPDLPRLLERLRSDTPGGDGPVRLALVGADTRMPEVCRAALSRLEAYGSLQGPPMEGVHFRSRPLEGELAFAFTGAASAYPFMGRDLLLGLPELADGLAGRLRRPESAAGWVYRPGDPRATDPFAQLAGSSFLCQLHAELSRGLLGLKPDAVLGLSSGETNAMFALGVWSDMDDLFQGIDASELYRSALGGRFDAVREHWGLDADAAVEWESWRVRAPADAVAAAVGARERVYLCIVNTREDCVIAGDRAACRQLLADLGDPPAVPLGHDLAIHCAAAGPFEAEWRRLHTRPTRPVAGVRFYSNYFGGVYAPTEALVAEALTGQALVTLDLPRIVERAWEDGVRIFVEHGPRNTLSVAIREILGDREHLSVPLDRPGVSGLLQAFHAAAQLWCAGVEVELDALVARTSPLATREPSAAGPTVSFRLRPLPVDRPASVPVRLESAVAPLDVYRPPRLTGGAAGGRVLPAAPPLARLARSGRRARVATPARIPSAPTAVVSPALLAAPAVVHDLPLASPAPSASVAARELLLSQHRSLVEAHAVYLQAQSQAMRAYLESMERIRLRVFGGGAPLPLAAAPSEPPVPSGPLPGLNGHSAPAVPEPVAPVDDEPSGCARPGPSFDRAQLQILAGGRISSVFGPEFADQDDYAVQVRMPEPPLLLCDRVLGIDGAPHGMGEGTIWTETEVQRDSWYLHHGRMPAGIFIESGQADLLLISWLGIDRLNRGKRAYRLLGCELVFHGELPKPGDTLEFEIHVDGHARHGDVRLFFFHYDCRIDGELRLSVRNGQAGFFSRQELHESAGVIWSPQEAEYAAAPTLDPAPEPAEKRSFTAEEVDAYLAGDLVACFGERFFWADPHTRTPGTPRGARNFLGTVTDFDRDGGPARRGYLRVETAVHPDDWFFDGHFKNDPCMPGTLMAEGCLQAMAFYLAALGFTLQRDGWRFEPVPDTRYRFQCRGQVTPESSAIVYELFVDEIVGGDTPTLFAHVLCTVDGRKAFLCERLGLRLVPDWPLTSMSLLDEELEDHRPLARVGDFAFDHRSLIHCAWGRPTLAFGEGFARYDGPRRSPRLPGPPYHFMTRILELEAEMGRMEPGAKVRAVYDLPPDAWYFAENGSPTMPNCVLMEIALQPCGWLASFTLDPEYSRGELVFRNLDGDSVQHREIGPADDSIVTEVELLSVSRAGELAIEKFSVRCSIAGETVLEMETVFGFFPPSAMESQKGFGTEPTASMPADDNLSLELASRPPRLFPRIAGARLPASRLLMLDRITSHWPAAGEAGLGAIRAEKDVNPREWFFRSHFFQDPVQPGSLGVEAILQAIQAFMLLEGMDAGLEASRFQPIDVGGRALWHYRGQVTPERKRVTVEFEVTERGSDDRGVFVVGVGRLSVDGLHIYRLPRIGMRIISDRGAAVPWSLELSRPEHAWLGDHRPTHTLPALPLTCEMEMMASAAAAHFPGVPLAAVELAEARRWLTLPEGRAAGRVRVESVGEGLVEAWLEERMPDGQFATSATARLRYGTPELPASLPALEPLEDPRQVQDPYDDGSLFHGPAFRLMRDLVRGRNGARAVLDPAPGGVPRGALHPVLLDAALHCVPHDDISLWAEGVEADLAAYPTRIEALWLFRSLDSREPLVVEARFRGLDGGRFPRTHLRISDGAGVIAAFDLVEVLLPKGRLGAIPPASRTAFIRDGLFVPGAALAEVGAHATVLLRRDVLRSDWLPGTLAALYRVPGDAGELTREIALRDHVAAHLRIHPRDVLVGGDAAACLNLPLNAFPLTVEPLADPDGVRVRSGSPGPLRWDVIRDDWVARAGGEPRLVHDLGVALIRRFTRRVVLSDPRGFEALRGTPVLYLANHQTAVESFLFLAIIATLGRVPAGAIAKAEHRESWIGKVHRLAEHSLGAGNPLRMLFFDRARQTHMLELLRAYGEGIGRDPFSLLVHVDGTRAQRAGAPVRTLSSVLIDLAVERRIPVVPVRFAGGLPAEPSEERQEFPWRLGRQDYHVGAAIDPEELRALPYAERGRRVQDAINGLGPTGDADQPIEGDPELAQGAPPPPLREVLRDTLEQLPGLSPESRMVLRSQAGGDSTEVQRIALELLGPARAVEGTE